MRRNFDYTDILVTTRPVSSYPSMNLPETEKFLPEVAPGLLRARHARPRFTGKSRLCGRLTPVWRPTIASKLDISPILTAAATSHPARRAKFVNLGPIVSFRMTYFQGHPISKRGQTFGFDFLFASLEVSRIMQALKRLSMMGTIVLILSSSVMAQVSGVRWQSDLETAKRLAADSGRLVLVHFWAPWCKPCVNLDKNVLNQASVGQAVESQFVPVKLNADLHPAAARRYGVTSLPTDVIVTPEGRMISKANSPPTAQAYVGSLARMAALYRPANGSMLARNRPLTTGPASGRGNVQPGGSFARPADNRYGAIGQTTQPSGVPNSTPGYPPNFANRPITNTSPIGDRYASLAPNSTSAYSRQPNLNSNPSGLVQSTQQPFAPNTRYGNPPIQSATRPGGAPMAARPQQPASLAPGTVAPPNQTSPYANLLAQNPAPRSATVVPNLPPGNPPLGLDGYCPVTLKSGQVWSAGDARWGAIHRGRTYLFIGANEQRQFLANPDIYSPVLSGDDPVLALEQRQSVSGRRRHGVFFGDHIYLFSSEETLGRFRLNPQGYADGVQRVSQARRAQVPPR